MEINEHSLTITREDVERLVQLLPQWVSQWNAKARDGGRRMARTETTELLDTLAVAATLRLVGVPAQAAFYQANARLVDADGEVHDMELDACVVSLDGVEFGVRGVCGREAVLDSLEDAYYADHTVDSWTGAPGDNSPADVYLEANPKVVEFLLPFVQAWKAQCQARQLDQATTRASTARGKMRL